MNLDSLSFALSQISYSVANLTKKNFKSSVQELSHLISQHGLEVDRHLLRCLFSHVDFNSDGKSSGKDFHQIQYIIQECSSLIAKPNFVSNLCYAVDNPLHHQKSLKPSAQLLPQISKVLKLTKVQEIAFGIALYYSSNSEIKIYATQFLKQKLPDLLKVFTDPDATANREEILQQLTTEVLHLILVHLSKFSKELEISSELKKAFLATLQQDNTHLQTSTILSALLYPDRQDIPMEKIVQESSSMVNNMMDMLPDMISEVGYNFCASLDECRANLLQLGVRELNANVVARVLGMMGRSHTGLGEQVAIQTLQNPSSIWSDNKEKTESSQASSWNVEVFVQVVQEMAPKLNWKEVVYGLDHPGFMLKDRTGLKLLTQALKLGLGHEPFPVELLFRLWKNNEGQISYLQQILKHSDILCFADYSTRNIVTDVLKAQPEDDTRELANWKSLGLLEVLLCLAEAGHYSQVQEILKFPVQHCSDVLTLGLLQINQQITMLHQDLLTNLIPIFLGNHPNSAIILQCAWHAQNHTNAIRSIVMHVMAEWYMRGEHDQTRLSRILDVAQDLKALSLLLNAPTFPFVIDLACLASRREYLKLDKWLSDKIREHGEPFIQDCVNFLKRRCPQILGGALKEDNLPKSAQLPAETLTTMLACLQACTGSVSQELSEIILTMVGNCTILLNKSRQPPPGVVKQPRALEHVFPQSLSSPLVSTQLVDPLSGILPGISVGSTSSSSFSMPGTLCNLPTPGSPAKMFSSTSTVTQSAFSSIVPPSLTSQLPGQLGVNTNAMLTSGFGSVGSKAPYGAPQSVDRLRQDMSTLFPEVNPAESSEVEEEANSYFKRIYSHPSHPTLSIDEVLDMLKRFQDSSIRRERDVFSCMLRNLYEEYRFFPQYPDKELYITAQLFGGIIERGLITYMLLGLALRYVLDALRKQVGSKMYYFGIAALDRFKNRLKDYPQYCQHLASISHFQEFPSHLIEYIEYGARSQEPPNKPQGPVLPPAVAATISTPVSSGSKVLSSPAITTTAAVTKSATTITHNGKPSIANATNIDTLLVATENDEKMAVPPESVQDKIAFIFNNLSQANIIQKTDELREVVTEEFWPWVAQYLVMKRASIEPNFHNLYANFMDTLKMPEFSRVVVKETFRNIKVLLRSDKSIANFSDRSLLKNLGHWLGLVTIGKNKPILQIEIDIKSLLIEAYHKGMQELLYVVPFVGKVLESCAKSRVFKPPNPWTIGIMNLLAELHKEQDLKLNLKFEIEVLCKTLGIDINDLKPGLTMRDPERFSCIEHQLSQPQKKLELPPPMEESAPTSVSISSSTPTLMPTVTTTTQAPIPSGPPEPRFTYDDISVSSIAAITPLFIISNQIGLFQTNPQLRSYIRPAIERAIQEWAHIVVDRSIKIALATCDQIVKKDFALDPEESRMRAAAHYMVRNLTAGMAMITCRDSLLISMNNNLKAAFIAALRNGSSQPTKELIEQAATILSQDNVELACAFIQRTAVEKALPEIDKRFATEFEFRKHARNEGRRYCDPTVLTYQAERMPEQIRLKVGGVTPQQMAVYEEFARNIPGFLPSNEREQGFVPKPTASYGPDEIVQIFDKLASELENCIQLCMAPPSNPQVAALHSLLESVLLARSSREIVTALALLQKAVEGLIEGLLLLPNDPDLITPRFRDGHLLVLKALQDPRAYGAQWTNKQVTRCLMECRDEYKYNLDAVDCLIRSRLVNMPQYDQHLALLVENGGNFLAIQFAMQLVRLYLIEERHASPIAENDLLNTIEALARIHLHSRQSPDGLPQLLDMIRANNDAGLLDRAPGGQTSIMHVAQQRQFDDPPGLQDKTSYLLRQWVDLYHSPNPVNLSFTKFVQQMNMHGILKTDDLITRFFRLCVEMCVELCYQTLAEQTATPTLVRSKCFHTLDAFVRLIALLVKHSGDSSNTGRENLKTIAGIVTSICNKILLGIGQEEEFCHRLMPQFSYTVLSIVTSVLLQDHDIRQTEFQQLPYHRIFIMLLLELNAPENVLEIINFQVLTAFCNTFHVLNPSKAPGFAYTWLELISHRVFVGRMLVLTPQQKGWGIYSKLLIDLFKFLAPFLRNAELSKPVSVLYKGTLRLLLVLLHDFPEFLCDYHYGFCDVIPPNCIQMRNLILSAFPRNMRLPDPFTPNLKVDMLSEIAHAPRVLTNFATMIQPPNFKKDLDSYIKTRSPVTFLSELRSNLQVSTEPGIRYNIPLINALVLYVGTQAISYIHSKGSTPSMGTITHSSHMDIFQNLAVDLDTEGRYLFLNAIANQLRYPNSHTHYFSCTLLYLFVEANAEAIQEQITRVLLERLIVNRPHPWGLLITFIELIKNPHFKFWNHEFVHCAPEIEKLLESVARSCIIQKQVEVLNK